MARTVLLLLSQLPHDPTCPRVGALRAIAHALVAEAFDIVCLGTTATTAGDSDAVELLRNGGFDLRIDRQPSAADGRAVIRYGEGDLRYIVMDVGQSRPDASDTEHGLAFNRLMLRTIRQHRPELILTCGGSAGGSTGGSAGPSAAEQERWRSAREKGCAIVVAAEESDASRLAELPYVDAVLVLNGGGEQPAAPGRNGVLMFRLPPLTDASEDGSLQLPQRNAAACQDFFDRVEQRT